MSRKPNRSAGVAAGAPGTRQRTNDSFQNAQARLGWGTNNQSSGATYSLSYQSRNRVQLEAAYRGSWIVRAAVDAIPEDMTRCGVEMSGIDPASITEMETAMVSLGIWDKLCETGKWARLYGGAIGVMLIDGQDLTTPLRVESIGKGQFKGLVVLDRWMVAPPVGEVVTEFGPDMGKPVFYDILAEFMGLPRGRIHYSRVIRLEGDDLPYYQRIAENGWGLSVLESLWDRLIAFDSATVGAGQLVYKAHLRSYSVDSLRQIIAAGGPALEGLMAQLEFTRLSQSNEGMTVIDAKDKFEAHTYTFAGLSDMLVQFAQQLSGALGIPLSRIFGQSPAGLSDTGEGPRRQYHEKVHQKQEKDLRTPLQRLFSVMSMSVLGTALDTAFQFAFKSLDEPTEAEKADVANKKTTTVVDALDANLIKRSTAMKELKGMASTTGMFSQISDEDIEAAEQQEQDEPPPGAELDLPDLSALKTKDSLLKRLWKRR